MRTQRTPRPHKQWTDEQQRLRDRLTIDLAVTILAITGLLLLVFGHPPIT